MSKTWVFPEKLMNWQIVKCKFSEPGNLGTRTRIKLKFAIRDIKIIKGVEMGHNRNKIS